MRGPCTSWGPVLLAVVLVVCLAGVAHGLIRGDLVKTATRARYGAVETSWTGLTSKFSPRHRTDKAVFLPNPQQDIKAHQFFKLSFSFLDGKFTTPWITVWDAKQNIYINYIEFVFVYSGGDIIDVNYNVDYNNNPEHAGKVVETFFIKYSWDEQSMEDVDAMLAVLMCGGFIAALSLLLYVIVDSQASVQIKRFSDFLSEEEEARPSSSSASSLYVDTGSTDYGPSPNRRGRGRARDDGRGGGGGGGGTTYVEYDNTQGPMAELAAGGGGRGEVSMRHLAEYWASKPDDEEEEDQQRSEVIPMEPFPLGEYQQQPPQQQPQQQQPQQEVGGWGQHGGATLPAEGGQGEDEGAVETVMDDFVSIEASPLPAGPAYFQHHQPIVRRKGPLDSATAAAGGPLSSRKED